MSKVVIEVLKKDFCIQIRYNRRAVKTYSAAVGYSEVEAISNSTTGGHSPQSTNNENTETEQGAEI